MDNLNTNKSETLVQLVSQMEGTPEEELGVKKRSGILGNMKSSEEYLLNQGHKIWVVYTPKHCS